MSEDKKFHTKKSLGQHFLTSDVVPNWLADAGEVAAGDTVVEVGPGTGALTRALLARGAKVVALEADTRAIEVLQTEFNAEIATGQLVLTHTDVRDFKMADLNLATGSFKVVANIPYYLSGMLFRTFLASDIQPNCLVFLVQKEVAKRITTSLARGEKESLLSLSVKAFGEPTYIKTVSRGHFTPPPKVDSGIILVRNIAQDNFKTISQTFFFEILHLGFGQKRKQLLGNLSQIYDRTTLTHIFSTLGIQPTTRAEDLELKIWLQLVEVLERTPRT